MNYSKVKMPIYYHGKMLLFWLLILCTQCNRKANPGTHSNTPNKAIAGREAKSSIFKKTENFETFYNRFHTDSVFQINRVQFPLKGKQINTNGSFDWRKEQWLMIKAKASEIDRSTYNIKITKKEDSYFEGVYCKGCAFSFEMEYKLINRKWYLVYLQEKDE